MPVLPTPSQDTISAERYDWRTRAARLGDEFAFAVDCRICRGYHLDWVEHPYTLRSINDADWPAPTWPRCTQSNLPCPGTPSPATSAAPHNRSKPLR